MLRLNSIRPLLLTSWFAVSAAVAAQDSFDSHAANIMLLTNRSVQAELRITEAQRAKLEEHADSFNADMKVVVDGAVREAEKAKRPPQLPEGRVTEIHTRLKNRVVRVLSATQLRRLREISLQQAGFRAIADPVVARRLGLTAAQNQTVQRAMDSARAEAAKLQKEADDDLRKRFGNRQPKTDREREAMQKEFQAAIQQKSRELETKVEAIDRRYVAAVRAALTQAQRQQFQTLQGKAFTIRPDPAPSRS
jgi:hypothetical protein